MGRTLPKGYHLKDFICFLKTFILAMIIGISLGTYSSIFLAGPLLSSWVKIKEKNNNKNV